MSASHFRQLAHLAEQIGQERFEALISSDNTGKVKAFCDELLLAAANSFFTPIDDFVIREQHPRLYEGFRALGRELGHTGIIAWRVKEGFTVKKHALPFSQSRGGLNSLEHAQFEDKPTQHAVVFWIPILVALGKSRYEQLEVVNQFFGKYRLPAITDFGDASLIVGLIFAYLRATAECVPESHYRVRTDTRSSAGTLLGFGFDQGVLNRHYCPEEDGNPKWGVFPLHVVLKD